MRKTVAIILLVSVLSLFFSCAKNPNAEKMLAEFTELYSATGTVYTPDANEGEDGYIDEELFRRIYIYEGELPRNFAILLNSHADLWAECGVFVCYGTEERERVIESCTERIRLLCGGENAFISAVGPVIFYSTMPDGERARRIWHKIVDANT